jgi:hypothetical protein
MFLAPLNYDKYFRKVFCNENISKRFLEDFLETGINEFEMLKGRHRITDDASLVEFDFRCRIQNSVVILDMQQWYKRDVSQRFYLYHTLNTGLQLEELFDKRVIYESSYERSEEVKDYRALYPVLTLIWMADDAMGFSHDYVAYTMTPELVSEFVRNERLWHNPEIIELLKEREKVLRVLDNKIKELDFLSKNRLIFMLQRNIVRNKTDAKYKKWFEFAQKTKSPDNKREDFQEYMDDETFCEIMRRLGKEELTEDDFVYIAEERKIRGQVERFEQGIREVAWKDGKEEGRLEGKEAGKKEGIEEGRIEGRKEGERCKALDIAGRLKAKGFDNEVIADASGLSLEEIARL